MGKFMDSTRLAYRELTVWYTQVQYYSRWLQAYRDALTTHLPKNPNRAYEELCAVPRLGENLRSFQCLDSAFGPELYCTYWRRAVEKGVEEIPPFSEFVGERNMSVKPVSNTQRKLLSVQGIGRVSSLCKLLFKWL